MGKRRNGEEMLWLQASLSESAGKLMKGKQADYGSKTDPLSNFRSATSWGLDPRQGVLLRMADKMARLGNSVHKPLANESVEDSVIDIINYAVIFKALHDEAQPE